MPEPPLIDRHDPAPVESGEVVFEGLIWDVRRDRVRLPGGLVSRDWLDHPGAVVVLALDEDDRALVLQQYRHPIGTHEWELPAGLLDVPGESPVDCAARELFEEADLTAARWDHILSHHPSPGSLAEVIHLYLARDLAPVPETRRHRRTHEERDMPTRWVPLDDLREAALAGRLRNGPLLIAVLAAHDLRERHWVGLTPVRP